MKKTLLTIIFLLSSLCYLQGFSQTYYMGAVVTPMPHQSQKVEKYTQAFKHLSQALSKTLKQPVKFIPYTSKDAMWNALLKGKLDIAYVKTFTYLIAKLNKKPVENLLTVKAINPITQKAQATYTSVIVTIANGPIKNLNDLKNTAFGFIGHDSTSGFFYPAVYLKQHGINYKKDFKQVIFYHSDSSALQALDNHHVNAVAVWRSLFITEKSDTHYRVLAQIDNIPNPLFVASQKKLTETQMVSIRKAFLALPNSAFKGLSFTGVAKELNDFYAKPFSLLKQHRKLLLGR